MHAEISHAFVTYFRYTITSNHRKTGVNLEMGCCN